MQLGLMVLMIIYCSLNDKIGDYFRKLNIKYVYC